MFSTALGASAALGSAWSTWQRSAEAITSGRRVSQAAVDPSAVARLASGTAALASYGAAAGNVDLGAAVAGVQGAALSTQSELVSRLRELAVQSGNGTLTAAQRGAIQNEARSLTEGLDSVASSANFNGQALLSGGAMSIQAGISSSPAEALGLPTPATSAHALGLAGIDLSTADGARAALSQIDGAGARLAEAMGTSGGAQRSLERASSLLSNLGASQSSALARLGGTDLAAESTALASAMLRQRVAAYTAGLASRAGLRVDTFV